MSSSLEGFGINGVKMSKSDDRFVGKLIKLLKKFNRTWSQRWTKIKVEAMQVFLRGYGLGVRVPVRVGNFSPHHRVQSRSGVHPASYRVGTRGSFPGDKAAGA
jgi:hypothetical protein